MIVRLQNTADKSLFRLVRAQVTGVSGTQYTLLLEEADSTPSPYGFEAGKFITVDRTKIAARH